MASMTAVELGADMCALARTNVRRGEVELVAAATLDPAAFPGIDAFTAAVREARKSQKLPRRCRAVVWGLPDGARRNHPSVKPLIAPLVGAGFRVESVISPCNALAALARLKAPRGDGATCWLAINRTGVAIVVVRPGTQIYSHSFAWDSNVGSSGSQARLLQRYSLVAFLAPEIRRAMAAAREKGTSVDAVVTCGNLPEIRSLTMPLIEELDVEVESLDTFEGLAVKPEASDRLSEVAASLRMACAGSIARPTRRRDESKRPASVGSLARIAAAVAVIAGIGVITWGWWMMHTPAPPPPKTVHAAKATPKQTPPPKQVPPFKTEGSPKGPMRTEPTPPSKGASAPLAGAPSPQVARPAPSTPATQQPPRPANSPVTNGTAASSKRSVATDVGRSNGSKPSAGREALKQSEPTPAAHPSAAKPLQSNPPAALAPATRGPLDAPAHPADKTHAAPVAAAEVGHGVRGLDSGQRKFSDAASSAVPSGATPEPLKDPVPRVTAILVSSDRHMATIDDGRVISVGDVVGKRVVVGIDERAVVLREPSGVQIRVGLGGKILGIERSDR
jgi:hypothetical protein